MSGGLRDFRPSKRQRSRLCVIIRLGMRHFYDSVTGVSIMGDMMRFNLFLGLTVLTKCLPGGPDGDRRGLSLMIVNPLWRCFFFCF